MSTTAPAASSSVSEPAALTGPPLRFTLAPTIKPALIKSELGPFVAWLGQKLQRPVTVIIADSYDDCGQRLAANKADVGLLPPLLYVQTKARTPGLQPIVLRLYDGSRGSDGYMLVRGDNNVSGAAKLKGKKVCLVDRESTTGYLLPRIWLRNAGIDPDKDITTILSGDHLAAIRDLANGECMAAAVYSGAYLSARDQGIAVGALRVLDITGRVPQDVLAAAPNMPEDEVSRLRTILTEFEPERDIGAPSIGKVLGISGFADFESGEFDLIRTAAEKEGILPTP